MPPEEQTHHTNGEIIKKDETGPALIEATKHQLERDEQARAGLTAEDKEALLQAAAKGFSEGPRLFQHRMGISENPAARQANYKDNEDVRRALLNGYNDSPER